MTMTELRTHAIGLLDKQSEGTPCKICGARATPFDLVDFNKTCHQSKYPYGIAGIPVRYDRCDDCGFIFTEFFDSFTGEQWSKYVYNDEYYIGVDPEYAEVRPQGNARWFTAFLAGRKGSLIGLDYGGGNGKTAELMRAQGWTYDCWDPFGLTDMAPENVGHYNFCSSTEVFEHTPDPVGSLRSLIEKCHPGKLMIMIGTGAHDGIVTDETRLNWWYAAPRNGHISLYSKRSLAVLAAKFGLTYVSLSMAAHLLVRGYSRRETQAMPLRSKLRMKVRSVLRL
jgi:hypothetical protein